MVYKLHLSESIAKYRDNLVCNKPACKTAIQASSTSLPHKNSNIHKHAVKAVFILKWHFILHQR